MSGPLSKRCIAPTIFEMPLFPAEQARIVRLLVHRVTGGTGGIAIDLRNQSHASLVRDLTANITREAAE